MRLLRLPSAHSSYICVTGQRLCGEWSTTGMRRVRWLCTVFICKWAVCKWVVISAICTNEELKYNTYIQMPMHTASLFMPKGSLGPGKITSPQNSSLSFIFPFHFPPALPPCLEVGPVLLRYLSFPPVLPSLPSLRSSPFKSTWRVWGSAVSSRSGVWGTAPAEFEFGAF